MGDYGKRRYQVSPCLNKHSTSNFFLNKWNLLMNPQAYDSPPFGDLLVTVVALCIPKDYLAVESSLIIRRVFVVLAFFCRHSNSLYPMVLCFNRNHNESFPASSFFLGQL